MEYQKNYNLIMLFILVAFISCSAEDKTGSQKPEGETKITIPDKYHGNYTRLGWNSDNDSVEISADKIVLKLDKKGA